jgi:DNA-binding NtrC family response regulator
MDGIERLPEMTTRNRNSGPPTTDKDPPSSNASGPAYLLASAGGGMQVYPLLRGGKLLLGRAPDCHIVIDHPSISRRHACLELGERVLLTDYGSRNGSSFRGQPLVAHQAQPLDFGESFSLGSVSLLLLSPRASPPLAAVSGSRLPVEDPTAEDSSGLLTAIAQTPASILIFGETGVGKEVLATRLHGLSGRKGPFVAINCAALSETLLESELFGHEKGAFTGAVQAKEGLLRTAAGGTILLDEIGEMSPSVQAKMLRAIETQSIFRLGGVRQLSIDVRFLAATHRDLIAGGENNTFRQDLYYRLAGFTLVIPPLRNRKSQIIRLATEILASVAEQSGVSAPRMTPAASVALLAHDWPGNVRELRNVIMRAIVLARGGDVDQGHIIFDMPAGTTPAAPVVDERSAILAALESCAGNQTRAARALGISRTTLIQKIRLFGIPRPRVRR